MKPLNYYVYETPKIRVTWNGKVQPIMFKTAAEALAYIQGQTFNFGTWAIVTPDGVIPFNSILI